MASFNGSTQRQHLTFFLGYRFFVNSINTLIDAYWKEIKIIQSNLNGGILRQCNGCLRRFLQNIACHLS